MYTEILPKIEELSTTALNITTKPKNMQLQHELQLKKKQLFNNKDLILYNKILNTNNVYYHVIQKLKPKFPNITNAWIKMYELLWHFQPLSKTNNTFHCAELPGSFIYATSEFCNNNKLTFSWMANSYIENNHNNYLKDEMKLFKNNPENWLLGIMGNGDLTLINNIRSISQNLSNININFITADAKFVPVPNNWDTEEEDNIPVITGEVIIALNVLQLNGNCIIKFFTFFTYEMQYLLYLLSYHFEEVHITKPLSSRPANSEIYVVCIKKKRILNNEFLFCVSPNKFINQYIPYTEIPTAFTSKLLSIQSKLVKEQIIALERETSMIIQPVTEQQITTTIKQLHLT